VCPPAVGYQPADNRLNAAVRQVLRLFSGFTGKWMLDHHHGVFGQPQGLGPDTCRLGEGVRDDGYSGAAALFGFNSVVETPRGAGASIGHGVDDRIAGASQLV
jgi:hypothetical protein